MEEKILKTLDQTRQLLYDIFSKISERGVKTEEIHEKSEQLMDSSKMFKRKVTPCHKRIYNFIFCCPSWWCRF